MPKYKRSSARLKDSKKEVLLGPVKKSKRPSARSKGSTETKRNGVTNSRTSMKKIYQQMSNFPRLGKSKWYLNDALKHLVNAEPRFKHLIETCGVTDELQKRLKGGNQVDSSNAFHSLCRTIIYQQLAGKAAATIFERVHKDCLGLRDNELIKPSHILKGRWEERNVDGRTKQFLNNVRCGLSKGKRTYIQSLAHHFDDPSKLKGVKLEQLSDAELRKRLTDIKGLGPWSVDMFMMFRLKRPDILATKDLAIRKGVARFYGKNEKAFSKDSKEIRSAVEQLTSHWRPYRSLGSFYMYVLMNIIDTGNE